MWSWDRVKFGIGDEIFTAGAGFRVRVWVKVKVRVGVHGMVELFLRENFICAVCNIYIFIEINSKNSLNVYRLNVFKLN